MAKYEHIRHISKDKTNNIYVKTEDAKAGFKKISPDFFANQLTSAYRKGPVIRRTQCL